MSIESGEAIAGSVPLRAMRLIDEWLVLHRAELQLNWARARDGTQLVGSDPLP